MKLFIIVLLRILILTCMVLPIVNPFMHSIAPQTKQSYIQIFYPQANLLTEKIKEKIAKNFPGYGLKWSPYGQAQQDAILNLEELVQHIQNSTQEVLAIVDDSVWGPAAKLFHQALLKTSAYTENRLYTMSSQQVFSSPVQSSAFLGIGEVYLPTLQFLGETSFINIDVVGKIAPQTHLEGDVVVRSADSVLSTKKVSLAADENGFVQQTFTVPITFIRTGQQAIRVQLLAENAVEPLNQAFSTVQVVHSKTSILHVAVSPDWSLRNLRQRLKFWPNLDLLSYYILREVGDDFSIPESQLTLIQFPTHKLFDEELPNFHGIIAQNFPLDIYLRNQEPENLVNYVKNGGRLVIFGGPLTFESQDPRILSLFPCENKPQWVADNAFDWEASPQWLGDAQLKQSLSHIRTHFTAVGCQPKDDALVIAQTRQSHHPTIVARNVGKGLVLLFLAGDWHTSFAQQYDEKERQDRNLAATATQSLFQWMVEFLQRRQDGGLRPPEISSPRLYAEDKVVFIKSRGLLKNNQRLVISNPNTQLARAEVEYLKGLDVSIAHLSDELLSAAPPVEKSVEMPLSLNFENSGEYSPKPTDWTIFAGNRAALENYPNPTVLQGTSSLSDLQRQKNSLSTENIESQQHISKIYPWLLGLALALLAVEQFFSHILWRKNY